jgi:putative colanic acid biosynthesis acetyltransferase WcaF
MSTPAINPYVSRLPFKQKLARLAWGVVYFAFFRPTPPWCLRKWRMLLLRLFGMKAGRGCIVYPSCKIWAPWNLTMGDYVCLSANVDCYCVAPITIGSKVCVSQRAFLCTASHDISHPENRLIYAPINIASFAWIAAQAFVGLGITIGEGAVVGACAVVTKDVEPWTVVAGNPARVIKERVIDRGNSQN